jgi:hypothetical protein
MVSRALAGDLGAPGGHCAPRKAPMVSTAPLPSPPLPAFSAARPMTRNLAWCGAPARSVTVTWTDLPS